MSITLDLVRTSDRHSKPALGLQGESLGQRLYTIHFSEMLDGHDWENKQPDRMRQRALKQAKNLPDSVIQLAYDGSRDREEYAFLNGRAILAVNGEKIVPGQHVYQMRVLWLYDCEIGEEKHGSKHIGYVSEVRRGQGAVIDFRTDDPNFLKEESEWGHLGHVLTYENRYTGDRRYRFRFCNGKMHNYTSIDPLEVARSAEKSFANGHVLAYLDPEYIRQQNAEALSA